MRKTWIALLALATATAAGRAQAPATSPPSTPAAAPAAAPFDPDRNPLDRYLLRWEEAMKKVVKQGLPARLVRKRAVKRPCSKLSAVQLPET